MDFRLKVFLAVANHLSFTKASKELGISQPAVTKHIQELENTYNVELFSRQSGRIILTSKGIAFREHAQGIVAAYENLKDEMNLLEYSVEGELCVGVENTLAKRMYNEVLPLFEERFGNVKLSVMVSSGRNLELSLTARDLDLLLLQDESPCGYKVVYEQKLPPQAEAFVTFLNIYLGKL